MMKNKLSTALLGSGALALLSGIGAAAPSRSAGEVSLAVPPGITLVDVSKSGYGARDEFLWRRLGDAQGNPLFTYTLEGHSGQSSCYGDCAKEFPPLLARSNAAAFGDWSFSIAPRASNGCSRASHSIAMPAGRCTSSWSSTAMARSADSGATPIPAARVSRPRLAGDRPSMTPPGACARRPTSASNRSRPPMAMPSWSLPPDCRSIS